ncbi:phytanoyl-CoA dioxygenase family protein [Vitreoscilla massiliensis]|uniref:Phytanoyl-CoA dioxygenase family protein n=1 Tax=Vitreoscilla massiliensis TaxID=1689272 RepID=A0ABY4E2V5_9NEIS|nr:phytanoyl-CoA dioxygenase family protein [Vitreoscilla massiliensis]UOO88653.1 phytanoyl-CoA dioxygenase family protein [Vitreoscilla massiliensis]
MSPSLYQQQGYLHLPGFYKPHQLAPLAAVLLKHHRAWLRQHQAAYQRGLINSHSLSADPALTEQDKMVLFQTIAAPTLLAQITPIFPRAPRFLNTQLFFDPYHRDQHNYWHRDVQYTGLDEAAQRSVMLQQNVLHCRIALRPERGLELIAGSHQRWDSPQEYAVRMGKPPYRPHDDLPGSTRIAMQSGDVLLFSANMLHRGLYGHQRLAFDIIYCDDHPDLLAFRSAAVLPTPAQLAMLPASLF